MTIPFIFVCGLVGWWPPGPSPSPVPPIPKEGLVKNLVKSAIFGLLGGIAGGFLGVWALGISGPVQGVDAILALIGAAAVGKIFQQVGFAIFARDS